jgi:hypothetical protein
MCSVREHTLLNYSLSDTQLGPDDSSSDTSFILALLTLSPILLMVNFYSTPQLQQKPLMSSENSPHTQSSQSKRVN